MRRLSATAIDDIIWDIKDALRKVCPAVSEYGIYPLAWYINTGRAATPFLNILINLSEAQIIGVAERLVYHNDGDYNRAIDSICQYIGYRREGEYDSR